MVMMGVDLILRLTKEKPLLGATARNEMPTFWYLMNFGDKKRGMLAYIDEFSLQELVDIAGFAQTLPPD
jgi:hypothetical protein